MHIVLHTLEFPTENFTAGGMCWAYYKIAVALVEKGHRITVLIPTADDHSVLEDTHGIMIRHYVQANQMSWRLYCILSRAFGFAVRLYNQSISLHVELCRLHQEDPVDGILAAGGYLNYFSADIFHIPYVCRFSSYEPLRDIVNHSVRSVRSRFGYLKDWMNLESARNAHACFAPSKLHCDIYSHMLKRRVERIITPHEMNPRITAPPSIKESFRLPAEFILFYGSLQCKKGTHILAEALGDILHRHPPLHALFIGRDQNSPDGRPMSDYVSELLKPHVDRVHIFGVMDQAAAFAVIQSARVVVFPSLHDNLPNALLETMALRKTVVVTSSSGTDDIVQDGLNGMVVKPADVSSLQRGIEKALALNPSMRMAMENSAAETIATHCQPTKVAIQIESLFETQTASTVKRTRRDGLDRSSLRWLLAHVRFCRVALRVSLFGPPSINERRLERMARMFVPGYSSAQARNG